MKYLLLLVLMFPTLLYSQMPLSKPYEVFTHYQYEGKIKKMEHPTEIKITPTNTPHLEISGEIYDFSDKIETIKNIGSTAQDKEFSAFQSNLKVKINLSGGGNFVFYYLVGDSKRLLYCKYTSEINGSPLYFLTLWMYNSIENK